MEAESEKTMILENLQLAKNYAYAFSRSCLHLRTEMLSEALFVLVNAVYDHKDHVNFEAYLKSRLRGAMLDIIKSQKISVPYECEGRTLQKRSMSTVLQELFDSVLFTPEEQTIIKYRVEGYDDPEIAKIFGVSTKAMQKRRVNICNKIRRSNLWLQ